LHPVTHHGAVFLASVVTNAALPVIIFHPAMAAMAGHHQA
jgi:hypothetical protein